MPKRSTPSIRELARTLGLSKATVANALNGTPTVAAATRAKVQRHAAKVGYQRNPMIGAVMSAMRRSRGATFQGVIAVAEITEPERPQHGPFHLALVDGCKAAAAELGFKIEFHQVTPGGLSPERLSTMLQARGIRGLFLLPTWRTPEYSRFDWSSFTGVYTDYLAEASVLNSVCCDHYRSIFDLLRLLHGRGYRRAGLVLETGRDERVHLRASAALRAFHASVLGTAPAEPLFAPSMTRTEFPNWLKREKPDVVLAHDSDVLEWSTAAGRRVPEQLGFVALNLAKAKRDCAGLNLHPDQIGRSAVEILIGQVQRQAWGLPRHPTTTTITAEFVDGATIAPAKDSISRLR